MFTCSFIVNGQIKQLSNLSLNPYIKIDRNRLLGLITNDPSEINENVLNIAAQVVQFYPDASQIYVCEEEYAQNNGTKYESNESVAFEAEYNKPKKIIPEKFKLFDLFYVSGNSSLCLLAVPLFFISISYENFSHFYFASKMSIIGWSLSAVVIAVVLLLLFKKTKEDRSFMFRMISAVANLILSLYWIGLCVGLFIVVDFFGYGPIIMPLITVVFSVIALSLLVSSLVCIISLFKQKPKEADGEIKKSIKPMPKVLTLAIPFITSLCMVIGSAAYLATPMEVIDGSTLIKVWNKNTSSYDIPSSVTSIGDYAFFGCTSLSSVAIPSSVTSIGNYAFYGCTSLASVTIPSSVTSIGDWAFYGCTSLTEIYYSGTQNQWDAIDKYYADIPTNCVIHCES